VKKSAATISRRIGFSGELHTPFKDVSQKSRAARGRQ
jgi:hypothetical protein